MGFSLLLPGLVAVAFGAAVGMVRWPLPPAVGTRLLSAVITGVTATTILVIVVVAADFVFARLALAALRDWCPAVAGHREVGSVVGMATLATLVAIGYRVQRVVRLRSWAREGTRGRRLRLLETAEPIAYAAPGRPGCVVVSQGMLDVLSPKEQRVLLAHERAHLQRGHHRYVLMADVGVAVLPMLRPLANQVRFATERSADEAAAVAVGGDRDAVARTIARAALAKATYQDAAANFVGGSLVARVEALTGDPPTRSRLAVSATVVALVVAVTLAASTIQLHHLAQFVSHVCGT